MNAFATAFAPSFSLSLSLPNFLLLPTPCSATGPKYQAPNAGVAKDYFHVTEASKSCWDNTRAE